MLTNEDLLELHSRFNTSCKPLSRIFTLLTVPTALFALVLLCFLNYFPLKIEIHSVILIGLIYFIYLFFVRHNAYYVSCKFKTHYENLFISLKEYVDDNLLTIGDTTKANGSVDDFLKDATDNLRNRNFSSIASGIFPTLGILGTFISIAFTMPSFSSDTTAALEKEISVLLGGVGTAFYVSIYGIFLSIWWTFFEKFGMSRFEHDMYTIKENTKSYFWTKIDIESIHIKNNIENFSKMNDIFEQMVSKDVLDNVNYLIEQRMNHLENLLQKELTLSSKIDENIVHNEKLTLILKNIALNMQTIFENFKHQKETYIQSSELLNVNIQKMNENLAPLHSENLKAIYMNIVKSIETMKSEMEKVGWKLNQELEEYDTKFNEKLKNSLEAIDEQTVKIIEDLNEFKQLSK